MPHVKNPIQELLISIVVPVYNVEKYLNRCIDSLRNQTYKNIEIILINDGSKDSSGELCDRAAEQDSRIKVIHEKNGGSSIARNHGIKASSGNYIAFVDSDDWIEPNYIYELINFAQKNNLKIVECNSIRSTELSKNNLHYDNTTRIENTDEALERIIGERLFAVWRRIYHSSLVKERYFIPHKIHQDVFYTIDIIVSMVRIGYINKPLYIYNVENNDSIIRGRYTQKKLNARDAAIYVVEKTRNRNEKIKANSKKYLVKFLTFHYNSLFLNKDLDKDGKIRAEIRETIKREAPKVSGYGTIIEILPSWFYPIFLNLNMLRIDIQIKLKKTFKECLGLKMR